MCKEVSGSVVVYSVQEGVNIVRGGSCSLHAGIYSVQGFVFTEGRVSSVQARVFSVQGIVRSV